MSNTFKIDDVQFDLLDRWLGVTRDGVTRFVSAKKVDEFLNDPDDPTSSFVHYSHLDPEYAEALREVLESDPDIFEAILSIGR